MFAPFGVFGNYVKDRGDVTEGDSGRYGVTKNVEDRYVFRVPSLRNVAITPPYFHDGRVAELEKAVELMGKYMLGRALPKEDILAITAFLKTLTGEYQGKPL
jgi:cytochrome c peroxidase